MCVPNMKGPASFETLICISNVLPNQKHNSQLSNACESLQIARPIRWQRLLRFLLHHWCRLHFKSFYKNSLKRQTRVLIWEKDFFFSFCSRSKSRYKRILQNNLESGGGRGEERVGVVKQVISTLFLLSFVVILFSVQLLVQQSFVGGCEYALFTMTAKVKRKKKKKRM